MLKFTVTKRCLTEKRLEVSTNSEFDLICSDLPDDTSPSYQVLGKNKTISRKHFHCIWTKHFPITIQKVSNDICNLIIANLWLARDIWGQIYIIQKIFLLFKTWMESWSIKWSPSLGMYDRFRSHKKQKV